MRRINSRIVREATKKVQKSQATAGAAGGAKPSGTDSSADGSNSIPVSLSQADSDGLSIWHAPSCQGGSIVQSTGGPPAGED